MCNLVARGVNIRWQHLIDIHYSAVFKRLYNLAHVLGCRTVVLPSIEQTVHFKWNCLPYIERISNQFEHLLISITYVSVLFVRRLEETLVLALNTKRNEWTNNNISPVSTSSCALSVLEHKTKLVYAYFVNSNGCLPLPK